MLSHRRTLPAPFTSFKSLSRLHTLRVDVQLLFDLRTNNPLDKDMFPTKLKHLELTTREPLKGTLRRASQDFFDNESSFFEFLEHPAPSLNLETFSLEISLLHWHKASARRMVVALDDPTINWLKATVAKNATQGIVYCIYGRNRKAENPKKYLIGPSFEASRPYYADEVDFA
jgi:hypothetical protein